MNNPFFYLSSNMNEMIETYEAFFFYKVYYNMYDKIVHNIKGFPLTQI